MKAILRSGFLALAIMALPVPANAGPFEDGVAAAQRGDYATAEQLWRPLAEMGDARGQILLGSMYAAGRGVTQDDAEAVKWYSKAAEQGDAKAQYNLGSMYENGEGVPRDYVLAHMWFDLAATTLNDDKSRKSRDKSAKRMTPDQIAEAQRMAREWMEKHQR